MSELPDGREKVATLAMPLPLTIVGPLLLAIGECLEREGYTDVSYHQEGYVLATRPSGGAG